MLNLVFYCEEADQRAAAKGLNAYITNLRKKGDLVWESWHPNAIIAGEEWYQKIVQMLQSADLFILVSSPDLCSNDFFWSVVWDTAKANNCNCLIINLRPVEQPEEFKSYPLIPDSPITISNRSKGGN